MAFEEGGVQPFRAAFSLRYDLYGKWKFVSSQGGAACFKFMFVRTP